MKNLQSPQIKSLQNLYPFSRSVSNSHQQHWPLQSHWLSSSCSYVCCFLEVFFFFFSCSPYLASLCLGLCIIQKIVNNAKASCLTTINMGSESKSKDDIWGALGHFGSFFLTFFRQYCCLPRVKDISDHLSLLRQSVGHELPGQDGCCVIHNGSGSLSRQGEKEQMWVFLMVCPPSF